MPPKAKPTPEDVERETQFELIANIKSCSEIAKRLFDGASADVVFALFDNLPIEKDVEDFEEDLKTCAAIAKEINLPSNATTVLGIYERVFAEVDDGEEDPDEND